MANQPKMRIVGPINGKLSDGERRLRYVSDRY